MNGSASGAATGARSGTPSWETVIGLEVHVQLRTAEKLFCADSTTFGAKPNSHVCPVCLGLPGALPVLNAEAVDLAITAALGLDCQVHGVSVFARKSYFYPDLPKGYQITQFEEPLATAGSVTVRSGPGSGSDARPIRIRRIHLEEDAGKSIHDRVPEGTAVDLNRAGVPLIEIVTEPDLGSPAEARAVLQGLKRALEYLGVSDCNMEEGSLRVDANVSLRARGSSELGVKTEIKNMNSFSAVEKALHRELERQKEVLGSGEAVVQETLLWDERAGTVRSMRSKEESHDYRYFPDPDLPPLRAHPDRVARLRAGLPELPHERERRFVDEFALPDADVQVLTSSRALADYFEEVASLSGDAKTAANWIRGPILKESNRVRRDIAHLGPTPAEVAELIALVANDTLSGTMGRTVLGRMVDSGRPAPEIVAAEGLAQVQDTDELERWVEAVLAESPEEVERYREGEARLIGHFIGRVMQQSGARADPKATSELLRERLGR